MFIKRPYLMHYEALGGHDTSDWKIAGLLQR